MINAKRRLFGGIAIAALAPVLAVTLVGGQTKPAAAVDPLSDGARNVRLVGYNDLQGREALVVTTKSDPYHIKEVGYYIPKINKNSHPIAKGQKTAIQINDVDIDHRGLVYASDRVGTGLFILEYTGGKKRQGTN